jgi:ABC-2 type transport system permease protein
MKYLRSLLLALQSTFIGRVNIFGWFIAGCIPAITLSLVWLAILGQRESINGFTKGDFIIYYLSITFGWYIVGGTFSRPLGNKIRNGYVSISLLKPFNAVLGEGVNEQAFKIVSLIFAIPSAVFILYFFRGIVHFDFTLEKVIFLIISLILGGINFAFVEALVGMSTFWIMETWATDQLNNILRALFGGTLIPLALMPPALLFLSNLLPFKYMFYVPVSILISKNQNPLLDIGIQALYILIFYILYKLVWRMGLKRFEGVGI